MNQRITDLIELSTWKCLETLCKVNTKCTINMPGILGVPKTHIYYSALQTLTGYNGYDNADLSEGLIQQYQARLENLPENSEKNYPNLTQ